MSTSSFGTTSAKSNLSVSSVSYTSNSKRAKSNNTSGSISGKANVPAGYNATNQYLRSVLIHPMGPPLMAYLNESEEFETIAEQFIPKFDKRAFNDEDKKYKNKYDTILKEAMGQKWDKEKTLTDDLCHRIANIFQEEGNRMSGLQPEIHEQINVQQENDVNNRNDQQQADMKQQDDDEMDIDQQQGEVQEVDMQQQEDGTKLENEQRAKGMKWQCYGGKHIMSSSVNKNRGYADILISQGSSAVLLVEFGLKNKIWWAKHHQNTEYAFTLLENKNSENLIFDKPMLLATITIDQSEPYASRFGVFLCTKIKNSRDYRMALLWRTATTDLEAASNAFGKIIYASELCGKWRDQCKSANFSYLGPSCSRLGNYVYRCYDNRLRPTSRNPNYYTSVQDPKAETLLYIPDPDQDESISPNHLTEALSQDIDSAPKYDFTGKFEDILSNEEKFDWLWQFKGKVLIISTTFYDGLHYAERPEHFLPIVEALVKLHGAGYVHGDIRAFNMVLQCNTVPTTDDAKQGPLIEDITTFSVDGNKPTGAQSIEYPTLLDHLDDCKPINDITQESRELELAVAFPSGYDETKSIEKPASRDNVASKTNSKFEGYLIDFDMSGKQGEAHYPEGYVSSLGDGTRIGDAGKLVTFYDDWFALYFILFILHDLVCSDESIQSILDREKNKCYKALNKSEDSFDIAEFARNVTAYLNLAVTHDCELVPGVAFKKYLKDNSMLDRVPYNTNNQSAKTNAAPSGSPKLKVK